MLPWLVGGSGFSGLAREEAEGWEAVEKTRAVRSVASAMLTLFVTPWAMAHQAPVSMGFSRQEYWSGLSRPSPGDLPDPGLDLSLLLSPALQADSLSLSHQGSSEETPVIIQKQNEG